MELTSSLDISEMEAMIPQIVAFGRRTLREQCTTSAGIIAVNTRRETPFVTVGEIDEELDVVKMETNKNPRFIKSGLATHGTLRVGTLQWTEGMMIALQRANPTSPFSLLTGNRWPVAYPGGLRGYDRWAFFKAVADRMKPARHSSTHFLQSGWGPGIKKLLGSPDFKGWNTKYGGGITRSEKNLMMNDLNTLSPAQLGDAEFHDMGDEFAVTTENKIGESGNDVLDKKHRKAMYDIGLPVLQQEFRREESVMRDKIQDYIDRGFIQRF